MFVVPSLTIATTCVACSTHRTRQPQLRRNGRFKSEGRAVAGRGGVGRALIDPQYGAAQAIAAGSLPGNTGLLVTIEAASYSNESNNRRSTLLENWSVEDRPHGRVGGQDAPVLPPQKPGGQA